jgi:hypothetical protein
MPVALSDFLVCAAVVAVIGYFAAGAVLCAMRWVMGRTDWNISFRLIDFVLGAIERFIALALFVFYPDQLPWFIGAWVALKFAANWKRYPAPVPASTSKLRANPRSAEKRLEEAAEGSLLFLIGNALSFGTAIGGGILLQLWFGISMPVMPTPLEILE